jgi:hypothetical protein
VCIIFHLFPFLLYLISLYQFGLHSFPSQSTSHSTSHHIALFYVNANPNPNVTPHFMLQTSNSISAAIHRDSRFQPLKSNRLRHGNSLLHTWDVPMLPTRHHHANAATWKNQTFVLFPLGSFSFAIHNWEAVGSSYYHSLHFIFILLAATCQTMQDCCAAFCNDISHTWSFSSTICQLFGVGFGFPQ